MQKASQTHLNTPPIYFEVPRHPTIRIRDPGPETRVQVLLNLVRQQDVSLHLMGLGACLFCLPRPLWRILWQQQRSNSAELLAFTRVVVKGPIFFKNFGVLLVTD